MVTVSDVEHSESQEIAGPELTVDGQVAERELAGLLGHLQSDSDRPERRQLERWFLPDQLSLVSGYLACRGHRGWSNHDLSPL